MQKKKQQVHQKRHSLCEVIFVYLIIKYKETDNYIIIVLVCYS